MSQIALRMLLGAIMTLPFHGVSLFSARKEIILLTLHTAERTWDDSVPAAVNSQLHTGWSDVNDWHRWHQPRQRASFTWSISSEIYNMATTSSVQDGQDSLPLRMSTHHVAGAAPKYPSKSSHRSAMLALELLNCRKRLSTRAKSVL